MGRVIAAKMQERSGQTVLVDNRPGAASTIAGDITARSAPDGHTMFITLGTILSSSPFLYPKLPYDIMKDFAYVWLLQNCSASPLKKWLPKSARVRFHPWN